MKIDISKYEQHYHKGNAYVDNWREGIKIIPFENHLKRSGFDKSCSLQGTTGEFFRRLCNDSSSEIINFEESVEKPVRAYLAKYNKLSDENVKELVEIIRDVLYVDGNLNITELAFLKYLPTVPRTDNLNDATVKKYDDGQKKLASFLLSTLADASWKMPEYKDANIFSKILKNALETELPCRHDKNIDNEYYVLPFIKQSFRQDFTWLMSQEDSVVLKYIHLLLHFYCCYGVVQTLSVLSAKKTDPHESPECFYFILKTEKVSTNHDAVVDGWLKIFTKPHLDRLFGKTQALDIVNTLLGGNIGLYPAVLARLNETPFVENLPLIKNFLRICYNEKLAHIGKRNREQKIDDRFLSEFVEREVEEISTYEDFFEKLEKLCTTLQSSEYISRLRKQFTDLLSVRFLQRRRGMYVLTLDNEMLIFLVTLLTRGERVQLEELYRRFSTYGIRFNRNTRLIIEEYLLKLNLLIRKSDSGESQYVHTIL